MPLTSAPVRQQGWAPAPEDSALPDHCLMQFAKGRESCYEDQEYFFVRFIFFFTSAVEASLVYVNNSNTCWSKKLNLVLLYPF